MLGCGEPVHGAVQLAPRVRGGEGTDLRCAWLCPQPREAGQKAGGEEQTAEAGQEEASSPVASPSGPAGLLLGVLPDGVGQGDRYVMLVGRGLQGPSQFLPLLSSPPALPLPLWLAPSLPLLIHVSLPRHRGPKSHFHSMKKTPRKWGSLSRALGPTDPSILHSEIFTVCRVGSSLDSGCAGGVTVSTARGLWRPGGGTTRWWRVRRSPVGVGICAQ